MAQIIRPLMYNDIDGLVAMHKAMEYEYPLPDRKVVIIGNVVEENGHAIGYGLLHPIIEASIVVDKNQSIRSRIEAIRQIISFGHKAAEYHNISQLYTFTDEPFTGILRKMGFNPAKGDVSVKDIV